MAIIYSKKQDGSIDVLAAGKVTRESKVIQTTKGNVVKFGMAYGKKEYLDVDVWSDKKSALTASRLEHGDEVLVMGRYEVREYNGKEYKSVSADFVIAAESPQYVSMMASAPTSGADADPKAEDFTEIEYDGTLPF